MPNLNRATTADIAWWTSCCAVPGVVPELHAILGLQGIKPQHRHLEGKIVPRLGDGDDEPVELHEALFDEALTVRRLRVDEVLAAPVSAASRAKIGSISGAASIAGGASASARPKPRASTWATARRPLCLAPTIIASGRAPSSRRASRSMPATCRFGTGPPFTGVTIPAMR